MNEEKPKLILVLWFPLLFVMFITSIKLYELYMHVSFSDWGILPKTPEGLKGIITAPLLHSDLKHLFSNSVPLLVLTTALVYFYKEIKFKVFFLIYFMHGLWLWSFGRHSYHLGASGIIYGLAAFIFFSGLLRKHINLMALSLLTIFLYGSFVWGVTPFYLKDPNISWESHLAGMLAGSILAWFYRKEGPQRKVYDWENEEEDEEEDDELKMKNEEFSN